MCVGGYIFIFSFPFLSTSPFSQSLHLITLFFKCKAVVETEMISWWPLWDVGVHVGAGQVGDGGRGGHR